MPPDYHSRSLAEAQPGDTVEILDILFEEQREYCTQQGLVRGTFVSLREHTAAGVLLDLPSGQAVRVDPRLARFIEIRIVQDHWLAAPGEAAPGIQVPAV